MQNFDTELAALISKSRGVSYAAHKETTADKILEILDEKNLTQFVYDMYELYHSEAIENAFTDLDSLIKTGKPAY